MCSHKNSNLTERHWFDSRKYIEIYIVSSSIHLNNDPKYWFHKQTPKNHEDDMLWNHFVSTVYTTNDAYVAFCFVLLWLYFQ